MKFVLVLIFLIPAEWHATTEMVSRQLSSYSAAHKNENMQNAFREKSQNKFRRQFSVCAVGCPAECSPRCEPSCCVGGGVMPPPVIRPTPRVAVRYAAPAYAPSEPTKYVAKVPAPPPNYKLVSVPQVPPPTRELPPNLACGPTCNPACISNGCSPSCCNLPLYPATEPIAPISHQMSPGQITSAGCSPVCANHWVATFTGTIYSQNNPPACPPKCMSSCCNPPPAYINLMKSCAPDCAPTYYPECCLGTSTIPYQPPDPFQIQRTSYSPCSSMCAPTYTPSCCKRAAVLPPLKRK